MGGSGLVQNVFLLVFAALLTGLLVPLILRLVDDRKLRHTKIVDAQAQVLDDVSETLW